MNEGVIMQLFKKRSLLLGVIISIIVLILLVVLYNVKKNNVLFQSSYENYAWNNRSYGYKIYRNGVISEYDDYDHSRQLKSAKITNEELIQLKELVNMVKDKYEVESGSVHTIDAGVTTVKVYSSKLSKWVILSRHGDQVGVNSSDVSQEILEFTNQLYNKYLY